MKDGRVHIAKAIDTKKVARYIISLTSPPSLLSPPPPKQQVLEEQTEVFSSYKPTITIGQPHPSPVIESGLLSSVPLPPLAYDALALPPDVISQGKLSSLQLESILYAGQRHRLVQNGVRAGFFLGDSTGTGKGRQLAGMILDNIARGRRKHMWVSTSNDLKQEAIRDFADIGASGVLVKDMAELDAAAGPLGMSKEFVNASSGLVIFTTYSTLIGHKRLGKKQLQGMATSSKGSKTDPSTKVARVDQLVDFFGGEAFDGIIAFDECHKARGSHVNPEQSSKASQAALELQRRLPLARIVYASATGVDSLEQVCLCAETQEKCQGLLYHFTSLPPHHLPRPPHTNRWALRSACCSGVGGRRLSRILRPLLQNF
jgi:hypothetical protein